MLEEALYRFLVLFSAGLGLALAGGAHYALARSARLLRWGVICGSALVCSMSIAAFGPLHLSLQAFGLIGAGIVLHSLASSARVRCAIGKSLAVAAQPSVAAGIFLILGVAAMAGSFALFTIEDEAAMTFDMTQILDASSPELETSASDSVRTDRGMPVSLGVPKAQRSPGEVTRLERQMLTGMAFADRIIRTEPAGDHCNCHGWVFSGGKYWISQSEITAILTDNDYQPVSDPQPRDLVVYRLSGTIAHSAVVRYASPGLPVMVEGKWGAMGVFLHRVAESCYGADFTYYRSSRAGHVLNGLQETAN